MALVYISFSQLGILLASELIYFHESCHSFESFKECIVYCRIMSWYPSCQVNTVKSWVVLPYVQRKIVLRICICSKKNTFLLVAFESVLWLLHTQILELCSKFCDVDVRFIMALLRRDYSCRLQLIIRELVLESK